MTLDSIGPKPNKHIEEGDTGKSQPEALKIRPLSKDDTDPTLHLKTKRKYVHFSDNTSNYYPKNKTEKISQKIQKFKRDKEKALSEQLPIEKSFDDMVGHELVSEMSHTPSPPGVESDIQKKQEQLWSEIIATRTPNEQNEIDKKSGVLWECVDCKPAPLGGHDFIFKLREKYDDITVKKGMKRADLISRGVLANKTVEAIFPAAEPTGAAVISWDKKMTEERISKLNLSFENSSAFFNYPEEFEELGIKSDLREDGVYLYLPDKPALLARWARLTEKEGYETLPSLDVFLSEGIAPHEEFILKNMTYSSLVSTQKEFVHDWVYHLSHLIQLLLKLKDVVSISNEYSKDKFDTVKLISNCLKRIKVAERIVNEQKMDHELTQEEYENFQKNLYKAVVFLGSTVDSVSAASIVRYQRLEESDLNLDVNTVFSDDADQEEWTEYFIKEFPDYQRQLEIEEAKFRSLWDKESDVKRLSAKDKRYRESRIRDYALPLVTEFVEKDIANIWKNMGAIIESYDAKTRRLVFERIEKLERDKSLVNQLELDKLDAIISNLQTKFDLSEIKKKELQLRVYNLRKFIE